jgi:ABC-type glycerol-3-phosphate transport system permease component
VLFARLGLLNGLSAAIVPWLAGAFGIFLMRQFFLSIPAELEEAAALDGCSRLQTFFRIVLPLAKPALATLAIFTLLGAWNDLVWPLIAINDEHNFTIQLGIANFQGTRAADRVLPRGAAPVHPDDDAVRNEGLNGSSARVRPWRSPSRSPFPATRLPATAPVGSSTR